MSPKNYKNVVCPQLSSKVKIDVAAPGKGVGISSRGFDSFFSGSVNAIFKDRNEHIDVNVFNGFASEYIGGGSIQPLGFGTTIASLGDATNITGFGTDFRSGFNLGLTFTLGSSTVVDYEFVDCEEQCEE